MLAGAIFLLAFFAWGFLSFSNRLSGRLGVSLWGCVLGFSALLLVSRCGMYLAFATANAFWPDHSTAGRVLSILGFAGPKGAWQYILVRPDKNTGPLLG